MSLPFNYEEWFSRGLDLKCFPASNNAVSYLEAVREGNHRLVLAELERIFTKVHNMRAINWINFPSVYDQVFNLSDGPLKYMEDWTPNDFKIVSSSGRLFFPSAYMLPNGEFNEALINELTLDFVNGFLSVSNPNKIEIIKKATDNAFYVNLARGLSLNEISEAYIHAHFLFTSYDQTHLIRNHCKYAPPALITIRSRLFERLSKIIDAWKNVNHFIPSQTVKVPLTRFRLYRCQSVTEIKTLLQSTQTPATKNLLTYLRCENYDQPSGE